MKPQEKTYTITIHKFKSVLHHSDYVFKTQKEANLYGYGIFKGYELAGLNPTGVIIRKKIEL